MSQQHSNRVYPASDSSFPKLSELSIVQEPDHQVNNQVESSESIMRRKIEQFLSEKKIGIWIENFISIISILSSISFVALTYIDHSINKCCCPQNELDLIVNSFKNQLQEQVIGADWKDQCAYVRKITPNCENEYSFWYNECLNFVSASDHCKPGCEKYYNSRMPPAFNQVDFVISILYLADYTFKLFISRQRMQFFMANMQLLLIIILPPLFSSAESRFILFFVCTSRLMRIHRATNFIMHLFSATGSDEV